MNFKNCAICGSKMKRNGKTSSGRQRWRCLSCGASRTHENSTKSRALHQFIDWLMSNGSQSKQPCSSRTFRRKTSEFWDLWPLPNTIDEIHEVIHVDGIYLSRNLVILVACNNDFVLYWSVARSENYQSWKDFLANIAPPRVVVTDGGKGFAKAVKDVWPRTRVQRCIFHIFQQIKRCTTSRPKLEPGKELYSLAKKLLEIEYKEDAEEWLQNFISWNEKWGEFLKERTINDGKVQFKHRNLRTARRAIVKLINDETAFTYLNYSLPSRSKIPKTNNRIESLNAQIRAMLRNHRGLSTNRRIKAVFWWCYLHSEFPLGPNEILQTMPTDKSLDERLNEIIQNKNL